MDSNEKKNAYTWTTVLFVDIVGFTALMQQKEEQAFILLNKFQTTLDTKVPFFGGEVINFYGDGSLCVFNDTVGAMRCAMSLQLEFQRDPKIPVRIGLHYGKVRFESDNVFGHTVNVTSRIESMGVAGGILFSDQIKERIKDEHDLKMLSFGHFDFKNVEESIEVFALANDGFALPRRPELKGKFKEVKKEADSTVHSIAIMPFEVVGNDPDLALLSDGFAEEIIYALSKTDGLKVAGKVSSFSFKGKNVSSSEVGDKLQVAHLLYGSIRKSGNRLRVMIQLVKVVDESQVWTERFDREMTDIFDIQEDVALKIVEQLHVKLLKKQENQSLVTRPTQNFEAYQYYLRGRQLLEQRTSLNLAKENYVKAIELDPDYALAHSGISYVYFYQVLFDFKAPSLFIKAQLAAEKAMQLDASLAEAYIIDGIVYFYYYWNYEKALEQYHKALALNPNADIYRILAYYHAMMLEKEAAVENAKKALELDPLNLGVVLALGEVLYRCGYYQEAIEVFEDMRTRFPNNKVANGILGACYYHGGYVEKAADFYINLAFDPRFPLFYSLPQFYFMLEKGSHEEAAQWAKVIEDQAEDKWISPLCVAMVHFGLGELDQAIDALHKGITERDPILWIMHSEPTWKAFVENPQIKKILSDRFMKR
jgi:adenylate cyclase